MGFSYHGNPAFIAAWDDSKEAQIVGCISESILSWLGRPVWCWVLSAPLSVLARKSRPIGIEEERIIDQKRFLSHGEDGERYTVVLHWNLPHDACFPPWTCRDGFLVGNGRKSNGVRRSLLCY